MREAAFPALLAQFALDLPPFINSLDALGSGAHFRALIAVVIPALNNNRTYAKARSFR
jgi:hypothetical protein